MKLLSKLALLALPVVLAACGGGGSSDNTCSSDLYTLNKTCTTNDTHTIPEGFWYGATTTELAAQTIVLENGQYFSVYTNTGDGSLNWMTQGTLSATNNAFTDSSAIALNPGNAIISATLTGTFTPKSTLAVSTTVNTTPNTTALSFNGSYNSTYDTALGVADVEGVWTNPTTAANKVTFQSGTATGTQNGCAFTGTFKPRATGKHLLDGTLTFQNATCAAGANVQMPVEATVVNGQLTIVGVLPQRTSAFYMSARR
jgi:hypothetical protein